MQTPLVTVLIPAYNAEATITRAIDSALAQTYRDFEVVVVDDGSHDATSDIVAGYGDDRIRLIRLPRNLGESGAMNEGIAVARGELVAFLDADDEWLPVKLARQVPALTGNPDAVAATCGCRFVDADGNVFREFGLPEPIFGSGQTWKSLLAATMIAKPCVLARATALQQAGPFDTALHVAADQDMWIRLATVGQIEFIGEYLTIVHDTPYSLTKVFAKKIHEYVLPMIKRHIAAHRDKLSDEDVRTILGERYTSVGRNLYGTGAMVRGASLTLQAVRLGSHVGQNLWYLLAASPPAVALKRLIRGTTGAAVAPPRQPTKPAASLLHPDTRNLARRADGPPTLIVTIDTEAEFDWAGPFLRTHTSVKNLSRQHVVQDIYDRFGVRPVYFVDYAVATQPEGYEPIRDIHRDGRCEIGAHLQAWETPPFLEANEPRTSFNHNLPAWLQKAKLSKLTEAIVDTFGVRPVSYRAGRYGIGEEAARILADLGYRVDLSVLPCHDLRPHYGPDFRGAFNQPYWFGEREDLLEIPLTSGFVGVLAGMRQPQSRNAWLYGLLTRPDLARLHAPGIMARLGVLERIVLTPESSSIQELKRLTRSLLRRGRLDFVFNYHSSALLPGYTPHIRSEADVTRMLQTIEQYLEFFLNEVGGVTMTAAEFYARLRPASVQHQGKRVLAAS